MKLAAFRLPDRSDVAEEWPSGEGLRRGSYGTIPDRFAQIAKKCPDAIAVIDGNTQLSYRELDARSSALAELLFEREVQHEDLVAILLPQSADAIIAILGTLKAGAAYLPLGFDFPTRRLSYMLTDCR